MAQHKNGASVKSLCVPVATKARAVPAAVAVLTAYRHIWVSKGPESLSDLAAIGDEFTGAEAFQGLVTLAHAMLTLLAREWGEEPATILQRAAIVFGAD